MPKYTPGVRAQAEGDAPSGTAWTARPGSVEDHPHEADGVEVVGLQGLPGQLDVEAAADGVPEQGEVAEVPGAGGVSASRLAPVAEPVGAVPLPEVLEDL